MVDLQILTSKQFELLKLWSKGLSLSEIASKLNISRQAAHKGIQVAEAKVYKALTSTAKANKIVITEVDARKGVLKGKSPGLETTVYITFSPANGVQVWFEREGNCEKCPFLDDCRRILLEEAKERGISLSEEEKRYLPTDLARNLFRRLGW